MSMYLNTSKSMNVICLTRNFVLKRCFFCFFLFFLTAVCMLLKVRTHKDFSQACRTISKATFFPYLKILNLKQMTASGMEVRRFLFPRRVATVY